VRKFWELPLCRFADFDEIIWVALQVSGSTVILVLICVIVNKNFTV